MIIQLKFGNSVKGKNMQNKLCINTETAECIPSFPVSKAGSAFLWAPVGRLSGRSSDLLRDARGAGSSPWLQGQWLQELHNESGITNQNSRGAILSCLPVCILPTIVLNILHSTVCPYQRIGCLFHIGCQYFLIEVQKMSGLSYLHK